MNNTSKYYMRDLNGTDLVKVVNKDLLDYLNKKNEFDERDINNSSDIASIYSRIKETIISQDEQIMQILTTLFKNQKIVNSQLNSDLVSKLKANIIIYGPTGTGKTEILKRISKIYNIPIVIEDATSPTGKVEKNVYPVITVEAKKGDVSITYPVGSINFYAFELVNAAGVSTIIAPKADGKTYNLAGVQVSENAKGLKIKNGKKFVK